MSEKLELKLVSRESFKVLHSLKGTRFGGYEIATYELGEKEIREYKYYDAKGKLIKKQKYLSAHFPSLKELKETLGIDQEEMCLMYIDVKTGKSVESKEIFEMFPSAQK